MEKTIALDYPKNDVLSALGAMIKDNDVSGQGELELTNDGFSFSYSQFGTTTVSLNAKEKDQQHTELYINFDIADTHKIVLSDDLIDKSIDKYKAELIDKYL